MLWGTRSVFQAWSRRRAGRTGAGSRRWAGRDQAGPSQQHLWPGQSSRALVTTELRRNVPHFHKGEPVRRRCRPSPSSLSIQGPAERSGGAIWWHLQASDLSCGLLSWAGATVSQAVLPQLST